MEFIGKAAAVAAIPALIAFGGALYDGRGRLITGSIFAVLLAICFVINEPVLGNEDCWIEWDGRSNRTVCD